jgi:hypothetical protein
MRVLVQASIQTSPAIVSAEERGIVSRSLLSQQLCVCERERERERDREKARACVCLRARARRVTMTRELHRAEKEVWEVTDVSEDENNKTDVVAVRFGFWPGASVGKRPVVKVCSPYLGCSFWLYFP